MAQTTWTHRALLIAAVLVAALLQTRLALRPGLWVDEVFSLAVATGHSLEHPAASARPPLGDFVDHPLPVPPPTLAAYAAHGRPPAGLGRVLRAVFLSDTSPPLYYVLLWRWTRVAGTSDAALRLFSTACALACLPLVWLVGRRVGDEATGAAACVLFALSPPVLYYATEGRMYALTWPLGLGLAWLALRIEQDGPRRGLLLAWAAVGAAGLLTHYFFAFVWLAVALWLWLHPGAHAIRTWRVRLAAAAAAAGLLVLPWYARIPESLGLWRVTSGWSNGELTARELVTGPLRIVQHMLFWGAPWRDKGELLAIGLFALLTLAMLVRRPSRWATGRPQLLWLWLLAAAAGPVAFDLLLGTTVSRYPRYGLPGVPAALLLVAAGSGALPGAARAAFVALLAASWWPGLRDVMATEVRRGHPFLQIAARLEAWHRAGAADLVLVHSIPSGSVGIARYMRTELPVASWTVRLNRRTRPAHLDSLLAGRCRVALVKVHDLDDPSVAEGWLRARATLDAEERMHHARIQYFTLPAGGCGAAGAPDRRSTTHSPTRSTGT